MSTWMNELSKKITHAKKIVFPEGNEKAVIQAAYRGFSEGICLPYLIGNKEEMNRKCQELGIPIEGWWTHLLPEAFAEELFRHPKITSQKMNPDALKFLLQDPLFFSVAYLSANYADAVIAGYNYTTGEVVAAGNMFLRKENTLTSSFFIMDLPNNQSGKDDTLLFADCAVNIEPTAQDLAQIAIDTAHSAQILLGLEPKVALLSSSTKGSINHETIDKVREATILAKKENSQLKVDGELQGDVAVNHQVALKKGVGDSDVAGKANILIFPNLDAGNIAYKLIAQLAHAKAYGPILQGLSEPLLDLSRGSTSEEIYGVLKIAAVFSEK